MLHIPPGAPFECVDPPPSKDLSLSRWIPVSQTYKTVIGGIIHCREAPTRQGLNFLNTERILVKRKRQESPRQAAFICVICAGFQLVPNSVIGSYWWRGSQNPDSEFRVLYVCVCKAVQHGSADPAIWLLSLAGAQKPDLGIKLRRK